MKKKILIVDDEEQILKALRRLFLQTEYLIYLADSGKQALKILDQEKIEMIITDLRMPDMDGYQLLTEAKVRYPQIIRLVLSGYVDEKTIFKLFRSNLAKMCIYKPWNNEELLKNITQVFELNSILTSNSILQIIKNIENLPTLNNMYNELCTLIDKEANIEVIEQLLMKDQSIVSNILRIANSAFTNIKTGSLKKAITYIGLNQIKDLVFAASISYKSRCDKNQRLNYELFSKHALLTNKICNLIFHHLLGKNIPPDNSCVGLLHGIGRIVLMNNFPNRYDEFYMISRSDNRTIYQLEKDFLGVGHEEMSGYLLNWWGLPYSLVEAILYHHTPLENNVINKELASVIHLADYYASKLLEFPWTESLETRVFDFLRIRDKDLEKLIYEKIQESE